MTDPRRARRARERLLALTPPAVSLTPAGLAELRLGAALVWHNPYADATQWAAGLDTVGLPDAVRVVHAVLAQGFADAPRLVALAEACEAVAGDEGLAGPARDRCEEIGGRARWSAAWLGHYPSTCIALHGAELAAGLTVDDAEKKLLLVTAAELSYLGQLQLHGTFARKREAVRAEVRGMVWEDLVAQADVVNFLWRLEKGELQPAIRAAVRETLTGEVRDDTGHDPRDPDHPLYVEDLDVPEASTAAGVVVFPQSVLDGAGKSENRTAVKQALGAALGARLPLVPVPADWDAWEAGLAARSPWLAAVPRALRADQGGRSHWGHTVLCVVGPPGCGKTRIVREVAQASGLAYARLNAEGCSDTAAFGTSVRWGSSQAGFVERTFVAARSATAVLHYDELEKASGSRQSNSGRIADLLHGLWEPETASAWTSVWLGQPINAGHLVHLVTVNNLDGLPSSLLDRMRIVRVGEPGPEHLALLSPALAREACRELGLDERWGDLDFEEVQALAGAWQGGSVRRLQRLVRGILRARDLPASPVARH